MRFSAVVAFLGLAASVSASAIVSRQNLPDCALTCLGNADYGTCSQQDNACLCRSEAFITSATGCITTTCQGDDLATALTLAQAMCAAEGVTLGSGTPTGTTSGGTTPPATTTGTNTAPTNTAPSTTSGGASAQNTSGAMAHGLSSVAAIAAIALAAVSL